MADAKHTPSPWRVEQGTTLIWGDCNPDDQSSYGMRYPIAECRITPSASWARGPRKYEEGEANDRLIAAAPDLLEALRQMVANAEADGKEYRDCYKKAVAAIAKAEGR